MKPETEFKLFNPDLSVRDSDNIKIKQDRGKYATKALLKMFILCKIKGGIKSADGIVSKINEYFDFSENSKIKKKSLSKRRVYLILKELKSEGPIKLESPFRQKHTYKLTIDKEKLTMLYDSLKSDMEFLFYRNCLISHFLDADVNVTRCSNPNPDIEIMKKDYHSLILKFMKFDRMAEKSQVCAKIYFDDYMQQSIADWYLQAYDFLFEKLTHENRKAKEELYLFMKNNPRLPFFIQNKQAKVLLKKIIEAYSKDNNVLFLAVKEGLYGNKVPLWNNPTLNTKGKKKLKP